MRADARTHTHTRVVWGFQTVTAGRLLYAVGDNWRDLFLRKRRHIWLQCGSDRTAGRLTLGLHRWSRGRRAFTGTKRWDGGDVHWLINDSIRRVALSMTSHHHTRLADKGKRWFQDRVTHANARFRVLIWISWVGWRVGCDRTIQITLVPWLPGSPVDQSFSDIYRSI